MLEWWHYIEPVGRCNHIAICPKISLSSPGTAQKEGSFFQSDHGRSLTPTSGIDFEAAPLVCT